MDPINCMVANVFGGSLASMPSSALDNETTIRSMNAPSLPPISTGFKEEADRDVKNSERPTNATDITAVFNWCVAVIWLSKTNLVRKTSKIKEIPFRM